MIRDGVGALDEAAPKADGVGGQRGAESLEAGSRGAARGKGGDRRNARRVAAQHRERETELGQDLAIELHHTAHFLPDERWVAGEGEDGRGLQHGGGDRQFLDDEALSSRGQAAAEGPKAGVHTCAREVGAAALASARMARHS